MKNTLIAVSALILASSAHAQEFVAAWDFSSPAGFTSLDVNSDFVDETELAADYAGSGLFQWSGVTTDSSGFFPAANLTSNTADIIADDSGLTSLGGGSGFLVAANPDASATLTFANLDFTGLTGATVDFAALTQNFDGAATINLGGGLSGSINLTGADAAYSVDASALDGVSNASFTMTFSNFSGIENIALDNFQITATAVPEPSAFAIIAGSLVLAVTAGRRRRKA